MHKVFKNKAQRCCTPLNLSHFENGCDVTAYYDVRQDWNACAIVSLQQVSIETLARM